jgi:hypothetical protein
VGHQQPEHVSTAVLHERACAAVKSRYVATSKRMPSVSLQGSEPHHMHATAISIICEMLGHTEAAVVIG